MYGKDYLIAIILRKFAGNGMPTKTYAGDELEIFAKAINWKKYYFSFIKPYIRDSVLEIGAGIGGSTAILCDGSQKDWTCLEPDTNQLRRIEDMIKKLQLPRCCKTKKGTIEDIDKKAVFNTILYIDVLEHIKNDSKELDMAVRHLAKDGFLIIGVPAIQWLYSKFDVSIGHYRRYNKNYLESIIPAGLKQEKLIYIDSAGLFASLSNKILRQDYPTERQVLFWSNVIINVSKFTDWIFKYSFGKQMIGVWKKV